MLGPTSALHSLSDLISWPELNLRGGLGKGNAWNQLERNHRSHQLLTKEQTRVTARGHFAVPWPCSHFPRRCFWIALPILLLT